jgi:thousand and one amino acid protein kinase
MNAMSALYHIAQNEAPSLQAHEWTDIFSNFVDSCLRKLPNDRPSSSRLLQHLFVTRTRASNVLIELIARTKAAVRELDNLNYRKMKKILMVDSCETESTIGDADEVQDEQAGGDSSKSNSITSEHSLQSVGISAASSQSSSSNSIPPGLIQQQQGSTGINRIPSRHRQMVPSVPVINSNSNVNQQIQTSLPNQIITNANYHNHVPQHPAMANAVSDHGPNNFATIRTTSIVTKQQKEHMQEEMHEQMSGYKRMRREHQGALLKLEEKCKFEMEGHKTGLDKEYEVLLHNFQRDIERLENKHSQELDRRTKQNSTGEKKLFKEITIKQDGDRKAFDVHRKKEYKANKERWKRELSMDESTPKRLRDATLQSQKDNLKMAEAQEEQRLLRVQKSYIELEMRKFKRKRMLILHDLENQLLRDELSKKTNAARAGA